MIYTEYAPNIQEFPLQWQRKTGVVLMVAGGFLLSAFVVPTVYGKAMAHLAVVQFRAQSQNHSLWDSARIRAYRQSLGVVMPPAEAVLRVPKAGIEVPVFEGTTDLILNRGVGHIAGTAMPGQPGNLAITGHRDGFFRGLKDIAVGDRIEVQHEAIAPKTDPKSDTQTDVYLVQKISVVFPTDTSVLRDTNSSTLTLITCYPFYYVGAAPQRYVVQATLLPAAQRRS